MLRICEHRIFDSTIKRNEIMTTQELIISLMDSAKWGQKADDNRPFRGEKWLSVKQLNFLYVLAKKDDPKGIDYFEKFTWEVRGYKVEMSKKSSNGCLQLIFTNLIGK